MSHRIQVENIKCGGCANSIRQKLTALTGVAAVEVEVENGVVQLELDEAVGSDAILATVKEKLASMGYPESGSVEGLKSAGAKAKSFVSCAVGRMSDSSSDKS